MSGGALVDVVKAAADVIRALPDAELLELAAMAGREAAIRSAMLRDIGRGLRAMGPESTSPKEVATSTTNPPERPPSAPHLPRTRDRVVAVLREHPSGLTRSDLELRAKCAPSTLHSLIRSLGIEKIDGKLVLPKGPLPDETKPPGREPSDWKARLDRVVEMLRERPMTRIEICAALGKAPSGDGAGKTFRLLREDPRVVAAGKGGKWTLR